MISLRTDGTSTSQIATTSSAFGAKFATIGFYRIAVNRNDYSIFLDYNSYLLGTNQGGATLMLHIDGGAGNLGGTYDFEIGKWYALGFETDGTAVVRLYYAQLGSPSLNVVEGTYIGPSPGPNVTLSSGSFPVNGNFAGVRWWRDRTLGPAGMLRESHSLVAQDRAGLFGEWLLQDGSYRDTSGFGNHMTSGGGTLAMETGPMLAYGGNGPIRKLGRIPLISTGATGGGGSPQPKSNFFFAAA